MRVPGNDENITAAETAESCTTPRTRKPYAKPVLESLGDIRDLTMGGSTGAGESGPMGKGKKP